MDVEEIASDEEREPAGGRGDAVIPSVQRGHRMDSDRSERSEQAAPSPRGGWQPVFTDGAVSNAEGTAGTGAVDADSGVPVGIEGRATCASSGSKRRARKGGALFSALQQLRKKNHREFSRLVRGGTRANRGDELMAFSTPVAFRRVPICA